MHRQGAAGIFKESKSKRAKQQLWQLGDIAGDPPRLIAG
jgi:hypothetical protein